jgi:serine/threonine-protein kinase
MIGRVFLGRYEAVRLLGEGGMGRVYLARQLDLDRQVAIKVMHDHIAADPKFRERFHRETKLMARFQNAHAVTLYDATLDDPMGPCIIMEYIRGVNLDTLLAKQGKFTPSRVGRLIGQLCEVLQAAHDENIIHRDLKPANLMVVDAESPRERIKVMDFGLAKLLDHSSFKKVTDTNLDFAVGTPGYICPEQVRGEDMDHRGDLYSVGVIIYELLTGRLPFNGPTSMDMLLAHATEAPPTFAEIGLETWVPPAIEELVLECLAKEPTDRPQCARDLAERYETALAHEQVLADTAPIPTAAPGRYAAAHQNTAVPQLTLVQDPNALIFQMEAWMPEKIAIPKIRGFVYDVGGEVVESVPGLIKVRIGSGRGRNMLTPTSSGPLSWLGFGRRSNGPIEMELRLQQIDPLRENKLHISVLFRPADPASLNNPVWRDRCSDIYCEVRAYLMGTSDS